MKKILNVTQDDKSEVAMNFGPVKEYKIQLVPFCFFLAMLNKKQRLPTVLFITLFFSLQGTEKEIHTF